MKKKLHVDQIQKRKSTNEIGLLMKKYIVVILMNVLSITYNYQFPFMCIDFIVIMTGLAIIWWYGCRFEITGSTIADYFNYFLYLC